MALVWCDSFEQYSTSLQTAQHYRDGILSFAPYDITGMLFSPTIKVNGTQSVHGSNGTFRYAKIPPFQNGRVIFGCYVRFAESFGEMNFLFRISTREDNGGDAHHCWVGNDSTGRVQWRGHNSSAALLLTSTNPVFTLDTWHRVEAQLECSTSTTPGYSKIWVDGVLVIDDAAGGKDTLGSAALPGDVATFVIYPQSGSGQDRYFDNLYIFDETGTYNTSPILFPWIVEPLRPDGDGFVSDFTGVDADQLENYLHSQEQFEDGDTSYVESSDLGGRDSYQMSNFVEAQPTQIFGVRASAVCKKTSDMSPRHMSLIVRSAGTDEQGTNYRVLGKNYWGLNEIWELDPDTGLPWTLTGMEAAELGFVTTV